jgi:uncharacterized membrane protein YcaP (DUF421 family)
MWHDIFHVGVPVAEKIIRPVLVYAFLVVALRLAGKRELAQLNSLDFVVLLAVANAVQNGIIGNDNSVSGGLLGAATLFLLNGVLAWLLFRHRALRRVIEGAPTILIRDGVLDRGALQHEELTEEELLDAVQTGGARDFADVELCKLEPNGHIVTLVRQPDAATREFLQVHDEIAELKAMVARLGAR